MLDVGRATTVAPPHWLDHPPLPSPRRLLLSLTHTYTILYSQTVPLPALRLRGADRPAVRGQGAGVLAGGLLHGEDDHDPVRPVLSLLFRCCVSIFHLRSSLVGSSVMLREMCDLIHAYICLCRYLLGQEYLGLHVGPEPTTDRYVAIVHGDTPDLIQVRTCRSRRTRARKEGQSGGLMWLPRGLWCVPVCLSLGGCLCHRS